MLAYAATLAPDVTFWDAGEFAAAAAVFGIPHPPGTPLYMLLARTAVLAAPFANAAVALAVGSALCTAAACAVGAALVARWTRSAAAGAAAGITAGATSTVWLNATEAEVYSAALLLGALTLWLADRVRRGVRAERSAIVGCYALALAAPLHLSALVVAPGAIALAHGSGGARRRGMAAILAAAAVATAGAATGSRTLLGLGAGAIVLLGAAGLVRRRVALGALVAVTVALSALLVLLFRARHDPPINQGNPSSWPALVEVVARTQYEQIGMWPRNAPPWLQLANLFQYADWQFALALGDGPPFSAPRTAVTLAFAAVGVVGAARHRRADVESWRALLVLLVGASLGVVVYLNFRAGPSIGWGILPDSVPHEARERDYFFAPAFWTWGLWAGVGAATVAERATRLPMAARALLGAVLVTIPFALNAPAVTRRREPDARIPRVFATRLLSRLPFDAVLVAGGDNDSYPLWYAQRALRLRRDVIVITIPLLPAGWYRAELARRHGLLAGADTATARWRGEEAVLRTIASRTLSSGRALSVAVTVDDARRRALGGAFGDSWSFDGFVYTARPGGKVGAVAVDTVATRDRARAVERWTAHPPGRHADPAVRYMARLLACPAVLGGTAGAAWDADTLLATRCRGR